MARLLLFRFSRRLKNVFHNKTAVQGQGLTKRTVTGNTCRCLSCWHSLQRIFFVSVGVREWAEVIGIMTDKETQGDEEVLIYAMTLINKVCILLIVMITF